jgi:alpha-L-fucosidase 2
MKHILLALSLIAASPLSDFAADPSDVIGPLTIWYRQPAAQWAEALPIGNGRLGAMVWGGAANERLDLNEDTLWSGEPYDNLNTNGLAALPEIRRLLLAGDDKAAQALIESKMNGRYDQSYQPLGDLQIQFPFADGITNYKRSLDIETAVAKVQFEHAGVRYSREVFTSQPAQAIVIWLTADQPGKISFTATLGSQMHCSTRSDPAALVLSGRAPVDVDPHYVAKGKVVFDDFPDGKGMRFETRLVPVAEGGHIQITATNLVAEKCNSVRLLLVAATSFNGPWKSPSAEGKDPAKLCANYLAPLAGRTYEQLRARHIADYQSLFGRVSLDLGHSAAEQLPSDQRVKHYQPGGDPSLAALYFQFGRYLLIASSRPGTQPANLQGIWNHQIRPPWSANWTLNCNAEINYWAAEPANLPECHLPLIELTRELSVDGTNIAKKLYGARGWMAHHNTDIWRQAGPVGGSARWTIFQVGGAWLCQHLWEHYAYSSDTNYLRSVWPVLRGAAQFYLDSLVEEPTHRWLVTGPDTNFENAYRRPDGSTGVVCLGPTGSMQIIRELFRNCIEASRILGADSGLRGEIERALPRLAPMQISPTTGELQEWLQDWQRTSDCQVLSSWGLICSAQITPRDTPALAAGLRKIFDTGAWWKRGQIGSWQGAFQASAYARLHDGDATLAVVDAHLAHSVNPSLLARFPGHCEFQIDGNLGITAAIVEMLLQSQTGEIELLPALPKAWPDGKVGGLRARGGFVVDMTWKSGRLASANITSLLGQPCRVRHGNQWADLSFRAGQSQVFKPK